MPARASCSVRADAAGATVAARPGGSELRLRGSGVLRWAYLFDVYVAALYVEASTASERVLDDVPKQLVFRYERDVTAEISREATRRALARRVDEPELSRLGPSLARWNTLYVDVQRGQHYAVTYAPGAGMELSLDGRPLGRVDDDEFARAFFAIWLAEDDPVDDDLRDALLGR